MIHNIEKKIKIFSEPIIIVMAKYALFRCQKRKTITLVEIRHISSTFAYIEIKK